MAVFSEYKVIHYYFSRLCPYLSHRTLYKTTFETISIRMAAATKNRSSKSNSSSIEHKTLTALQGISYMLQHCTQKRGKGLGARLL